MLICCLLCSLHHIPCIALVLWTFHGYQGVGNTREYEGERQPRGGEERCGRGEGAGGGGWKGEGGCTHLLHAQLFGY